MFFDNMFKHKKILRENYKKASIPLDEILTCHIKELEIEKESIKKDQIEYNAIKLNNEVNDSKKSLLIYKNPFIEEQLNKVEKMINNLQKKLDLINKNNADLIEMSNKIDLITNDYFNTRHKANSAYSELDYQLKTIADITMEDIYENKGVNKNEKIQKNYKTTQK